MTGNDAESTRFVIDFIVSGLLSALCVVLWFNFRSVKSETEKNRDDLAAFKLECAKSYANSADIRADFNLLFKKMEEIRNEIGNLGREFREELKTKVDK